MISVESFAGQPNLSDVQRSLTLLTARTGKPGDVPSLTTSWLTVASCLPSPDSPRGETLSSAARRQREVRLAAIKRHIEAGTYHVSTDTLARKVMRAAVVGA